MTFAKGAKQLVVQEALEITFMDELYFSRLTPQTNYNRRKESLIGNEKRKGKLKRSVLLYHRSIRTRSRNDDFLGPSDQMSRGLVCGRESTSRLNNVIRSSLTPSDFLRFHGRENGDGMSIDNQFSILMLHGSLEKERWKGKGGFNRNSR